jgi:hypothetical protein
MEKGKQLVITFAALNTKRSFRKEVEKKNEVEPTHVTNY